GLDEKEMKALRYAALLHDIGRFVNIANEEIEAAEASESEPPAKVDRHSIIAADSLPQEGIFQGIREGILCHHERYDGSGYPKGLARTEIPWNARIIAVADIYDAMTRLCPEEERLDHNSAIKEIKKAMGSLLDPLVVVVLEEMESEAAEIAK
ncbi:MAG: HD domain-containing protein, partial [Bacteroidales bacterium]|nr:HD domain-containing protein [Bacteroidales bacterium]